MKGFMKLNSFFKRTTAILALGLLAGCASYRALPLDTLCHDILSYQTFPCLSPEVVIAAKAFNKRDCKKYLDRDVISQGYLPVQLSIANNSDKNYFFSLHRVSLPCARPEDVAATVHTSTFARAAGYGTAALFFWPFAIPAVVDGINSANANEALDEDFCAKAARDTVIPAHSRTNMLVFIPSASYRPQFNVTLVDLNSNKPCDFFVTALR
jgi:hypothetical protein